MGELIVSRDRVGVSKYLTDDVKGTAEDNRTVITFTFTQSVEFGGAEIVGLSDREIIERARELVASQYDGDLVDGARLLLGDADADYG
jgi:hypothetical protein